MVLDEWLHPFARIFEGLADLDAHIADESAGLGVAMRMERAELELPIELDADVAPDGAVSLTSAPPTQHVETTYMPVFHKLRLGVGVDDAGA